MRRITSHLLSFAANHSTKHRADWIVQHGVTQSLPENRTNKQRIALTSFILHVCLDLPGPPRCVTEISSHIDPDEHLARDLLFSSDLFVARLQFHPHRTYEKQFSEMKRQVSKPDQNVPLLLPGGQQPKIEQRRHNHQTALCRSPSTGFR